MQKLTYKATAQCVQTPDIDQEATEMKKISNKEILIGAVAYKLNCSEECLNCYTKEQLKKMLED